jgi:hypothetical protein
VRSGREVAEDSVVVPVADQWTEANPSAPSPSTDTFRVGGRVQPTTKHVEVGNELLVIVVAHVLAEGEPAARQLSTLSICEFQGGWLEVDALGQRAAIIDASRAQEKVCTCARRGVTCASSTNAASTANAGSGCQCVLRLVRAMPLPLRDHSTLRRLTSDRRG